MLTEFNKKYYIFSILCLIAGTLIYVLFRKDVVFLDLLNLQSDNSINLGSFFGARFFLYNLSDAFWAIALMLFASSQNSRSVRIYALLIPICLEIAQYFKAIPGYFDFLDLLIYFVISLTFYIIWKQKGKI